MIDSDQEKDVRRHTMLTVSYALYGILGTSVLMMPKIRPKRAAALNKRHVKTPFHDAVSSRF